MTASSPSARWQRPAFFAVLAAMFVTTGLFYYFWRTGYSSDTAMGSLMSMSVLNRGERPIFYWQVGYQGTLEVYASALFFKLFGVGPRVASLWQMLCFWAVQALFFLHTRKLYDFWVALWASLFFTLSTPYMYTWAMRPLPNYTETFAMGLLLCIIARRLLDHYYVAQQVTTPRNILGLWAAFGAVLGFGLYTYQQIVYFLVAICVQLAFVIMRELPGRVRWRGPVGWVLGVVATPAAVFLAVGLGCYLNNTPTASLLSESLTTANCIKNGLVAAAAWTAVVTAVAFPRVVKRLALGAAALLTAFLVGWSPQLYFTYVLKAPARNRTALSGTLDMGLQRLQWGWDGLSVFFGVGAVPYTRLLIGLLILVPLSAYAWHLAREGWRFVRGRSPRSAALSPGPLAWLPIAIFPIFVLMHAVEDIWSARYLMILWFWFCIAFAWCLGAVWRTAGKKKQRRVAAVAAAAFMLVHNAAFMAQRIVEAEQTGFSGEKAIAALKERGIQYGYAFYWYAYAIDFYTQEDIILEPIISAYCPHYRLPVGQAPRFAFMDESKSFRQHLQMLQSHWGGNARVTDVWEQDGVAFAVIER